MFPGADSSTAIRVGIVGFGSQGRHHLERLWSSPPFEVVAVFDRKSESIADLPGALRARSLKDLLGRDTHVVVVATPPFSHFALACTLLSASKSVILEKPTAVEESETLRLLDLARQKKVVVLTHFNRRWDADFVAVQEILRSHEFGRVHEIESRVSDSYSLGGDYPGRKAWKFRYPGGGILLDWAPHLLDQLFELMGRREPRTVYCHADRPNRLVDPRIEEQFTIQMRYSDCMAILGASWSSGLPRPRWLVLGTRAAARVDTLGKGDGTVSWRSGERVETRRLAAGNGTAADAADEGFRELVRRSLGSRATRKAEEARMKAVAHGIELARRSCANGMPLPWRTA
jgi:predicted dehydrogenase